MNVNSFELNKQRMQQFEREVHQARLAREAGSNGQPVFNSVLAAVGEQLVELGSRLQERSNHSAELSKIEAH
jgi:hypothetical protein